MNDKVVLTSQQITKDLLHKISISKDMEDIFLNVDFMNGKYTIEKKFKNNFGGLYMLDRECENLGSEDKVFRYLRIGAKNEP